MSNSLSTRIITARVSDKDLFEAHRFVQKLNISNVKTLSALVRFCVQITAETSRRQGDGWQGSVTDARQMLDSIYGRTHHTRQIPTHLHAQEKEDSLRMVHMTAMSHAVEGQNKQPSTDQSEDIFATFSSFKVPQHEGLYRQWCTDQGQTPYAVGYEPEDWYAEMEVQKQRILQAAAEREERDKLETNPNILGAIPANLEIVQSEDEQ